MADPLQVLEALLQDAPPPLSDERDARVLHEDLGLPEQIPDFTRKGLIALYGESFPLLEVDPTEENWVDWARNLWDRHRAGVQSRMHLVERNRLFRRGVQWISSVGSTGWRIPPKPRDSARVVFNMVAPALDQRGQIVSEQRPGFKARPATQDPDDLKKAESKQIALEYQWDQQDMAGITREASYWAGTDGVVFLESIWDTDAGPWHEFYAGEQPLGQDGEPSEEPYKAPLGDIKTRIRRIEEVRVSANATATEKPWYWIIRDVMPLAEAVRTYGMELAEEKQEFVDDEMRVLSGPAHRLGYLIPDEYELFQEQETVNRYTIYCEPSEYLPKGLTFVSIGKRVVLHAPLMTGRVPMARWTDGSSDPSFYPTPIMELWIDAQMRVNAVLSKWVENVRLNAGPKLIAKRQSYAGETLVGNTMTVIEAKGLGSISDIMRPLESFSLSQDATKLLEFEIRNFENLSGWNDTSRGQFSGEMSGRAILAIREQLERIFAPPVNSAAAAMTEWAKTQLSFMKEFYDIPRIIGVEGKGRPDLAREFSSDDFDGAVDVWIDPETLMPMPTSLRLGLLDNLFEKQMLTPMEYRRRLPFAWIRDIEYPDEVHVSRARRCAEALRQGQWLPIMWMDNEMIHKDILEREILLQDDQDQQVRGLAYQRWVQLAMQEMMKLGGLPAGTPPSPGSAQGAPGGPAGSSPFTPATQPFQGTNPPVSAGTYTNVGGEADANRLGRQFDQQQSALGAP